MRVAWRLLVRAAVVVLALWVVWALVSLFPTWLPFYERRAVACARDILTKWSCVDMSVVSSDGREWRSVRITRDVGGNSRIKRVEKLVKWVLDVQDPKWHEDSTTFRETARLRFLDDGNRRIDVRFCFRKDLGNVQYEWREMRMFYEGWLYLGGGFVERESEELIAQCFNRE